MRRIAALLGLAALSAAGCRSSGTPATVVPPEAGESHLANIRQLTFGGQNAEAYFSADGKWLTFQRSPTDDPGVCDQQYVMKVDGSALHRISNGAGKTTCAFFRPGSDEIEFASGPFSGRHAAVDLRGRNAAGPQAVDLIFHQGDERRNHDGESVKDQRRNLVAQRFTTAGRHQRKRIFLFKHRINNAFLLQPERRIAKTRLKDVERRRG